MNSVVQIRPRLEFARDAVGDEKRQARLIFTFNVTELIKFLFKHDAKISNADKVVKKLDLLH